MHHYHIDKATYRLLKKKQTKIDKLMTVCGVIVQLATIPQAIQIFVLKDAGSVSIFSWFSYSLFSVLALTYAIVHGLRPLIIMNTLGLLVNSTVLFLIIKY